jgi:hypothetical protein
MPEAKNVQEDANHGVFLRLRLDVWSKAGVIVGRVCRGGSEKTWDSEMSIGVVWEG